MVPLLGVEALALETLQPRNIRQAAPGDSAPMPDISTRALTWRPC